jgi:hypothetical protein
MPVSWNAGTYYTPNDIVLYVPEGLSYIASSLSPNINRIPPSSDTYWTVYTGGGGGGSISLISGGANINVSGGAGPTATISVNDPFIDGTIQTKSLTASSSVNTSLVQSITSGDDFPIQNGGASSIILGADNRVEIGTGSVNGNIILNNAGGIQIECANTQPITLSAPSSTIDATATQVNLNSATLNCEGPILNVSQLKMGSGSTGFEGHIDFCSSKDGSLYNTFALNYSSVITSTFAILDCGLTLNALNGVYLGASNTLIYPTNDVYECAIGCYTALEYPNDIIGYESGGIAAGNFTKAVGFVPDNTSSMPFFPTPGGISNPIIITDSVEVDAGAVGIPALVAGTPINNTFNITQIDRSVRWWMLNVSISWTAPSMGSTTSIGTLLGIVPSIILNTAGGTATYNGSQYTSTTPANLQIFDYGNGGYGYGSLTFTDYININQDFVATDGVRTLTAGLSLNVNNNSTGAQTILLGTDGLKVSYSLEACFAP